MCGFLTVIIHESQHHFDLLRTPFGLSVHEKLAREYVAFERWAPTLLENENIFNEPLAEWALSLAPGEEISAQLAGGSPLEQAMFDLRGTIAFDEVRRGAPPRHITDGWGKTEGAIVIRGQAWKPVVVNRLWLTVRTPWDHSYLGPNEVIEGRTFAMCLLYLTHLFGPGDDTREILERYCDTYYETATPYIGLIEMQAGRSLKELLAADISVVVSILYEVIIASWFALHAPVSVEDVDVRQSVATKYLLAARFLSTGGMHGQRNSDDLLELMDREFAPTGALPVRLGLARAAGRAEGARNRVKEAKDTEMRAWYDAILAVIARDLARRIEDGYSCRSGMPDDGNSLRASRFDEGAMDAMELEVATPRVREWYRLRNVVVYTFGNMPEKVAAIRSFFKIA